MVTDQKGGRRTGHVAETSARVAGLASAASAARATSRTATVTASASAAIGVTKAGFAAVTGDVAHLTALVGSAHLYVSKEKGRINLVALRRATTSAAAAAANRTAANRTTAKVAVTGDVAGLAALVAGLVVPRRVLGLRAITA